MTRAASASTLQRGDLVTVYEDPITRRQVEGVATLLRPVGRAMDGQEPELWQVRFDGDLEPNVVRTVELRDRIAEAAEVA